MTEIDACLAEMYRERFLMIRRRASRAARAYAVRYHRAQNARVHTEYMRQILRADRNYARFMALVSELA